MDQNGTEGAAGPDAPAMHPLKAWRTGNGLTLAQCAQKVGTTRQVWHAWEAGKRRPRPNYLRLLRKVTNGAVDANSFVPDEDESELESAA